MASNPTDLQLAINPDDEDIVIFIDAIRRGDLDIVKTCIAFKVNLWFYDEDTRVRPSVKNAIKIYKNVKPNTENENAELKDQDEEYRLGSYSGRWASRGINPHGLCLPILEVFNDCPNPQEMLDILIPAMNTPKRTPDSPHVMSRVLMAVGLKGKEGLEKELEIQKIFFAALIKHGIDCGKIVIPLQIAKHEGNKEVKEVDVVTYLTYTVAKENAYFEEGWAPILDVFKDDTQKSLEFGADMALGLLRILFGPIQKKALKEILDGLPVVPGGVSAIIAEYYTPPKDVPLVFPPTDDKGPKRGPR